MKSTPPYAFFRASLVFGAVCPTYWPTRSSRVTETRWPLSTYPSRWRISAMRRATVVFPVPGLPLKHMCSDGRSDASPCSRRRRSTTSRAAISRMRVFTGAASTSSATAGAIPGSFAAGGREAVRSSPGARGATLKACPVTGSASRAPVALPGRGVRRVGVQAILHGAVAPVRPLEAEARLVARSVDDEAECRRLPAVARVVGDHLDVVVGELLAAGRELAHRDRSLV